MNHAWHRSNCIKSSVVSCFGAKNSYYLKMMTFCLYYSWPNRKYSHSLSVAVVKINFTFQFMFHLWKLKNLCVELNCPVCSENMTLLLASDSEEKNSVSVWVVWSWCNHWDMQSTDKLQKNEPFNELLHQEFWRNISWGLNDFNKTLISEILVL